MNYFPTNINFNQLKTMNYIELLQPCVTNSTHFTICCGSAICDDEANCPSCNEPVIGADADSAHERGRERWDYATRHWKVKL